jgi:UDP-N-acetylglucosamine 1-carboxyvinyltransferase
MLVLDARAARNAQAPYDMVRRMRASILVLAPLLARFGSAACRCRAAARSARGRSTCISRLDALGADVHRVRYIHARTKATGCAAAASSCPRHPWGDRDGLMAATSRG